ncbi:uncharacterized protein [Miscanthus floridulus]|uniref:uncharacterized protein n=1 Tax=Miscanthus floridulus TaxID=154761 RepID=UPI00345B1361
MGVFSWEANPLHGASSAPPVLLPTVLTVALIVLAASTEAVLASRSWAHRRRSLVLVVLAFLPGIVLRLGVLHAAGLAVLRAAGLAGRATTDHRRQLTHFFMAVGLPDSRMGLSVGSSFMRATRASSCSLCAGLVSPPAWWIRRGPASARCLAAPPWPRTAGSASAAASSTRTSTGPAAPPPLPRGHHRLLQLLRHLRERRGACRARYREKADEEEEEAAERMHHRGDVLVVQSGVVRRSGGLVEAAVLHRGVR